MDFVDPVARRVQFAYALPAPATTALVEVTVFDREPHRPAALAGPLQTAIDSLTSCASYQVQRREHGVLPMGLRRLSAAGDPSFAYAGLVGGAARACTGYAFQRIQCWADACSRSLLKGRRPLGHPGAPVLRCAMDRLFLSVLREQPDGAPELFFRLFRRTRDERPVRFVSDRGGLVDRLAVIRSLPTWLFLSCLPKAIQTVLERPSRASG
jgi:lycopene beta-cyclase